VLPGTCSGMGVEGPPPSEPEADARKVQRLRENPDVQPACATSPSRLGRSLRTCPANWVWSPLHGFVRHGACRERFQPPLGHLARSAARRLTPWPRDPGRLEGRQGQSLANGPESSAFTCGVGANRPALAAGVVFSVARGGHQMLAAELGRVDPHGMCGQKTGTSARPVVAVAAM